MQLLVSILFCFVSFTLAATQQTLAIVAYKVANATPWDPDSIKQGITGSEEAVIYMSKELALLGYQVVVLGDPPKNSPYSKADSNPRFISVDADDGKKYDIAIAWRMPQAGEALKKRAKQVYLWPHDTYHWKLSDKQINAFDGVLWISNWQRAQWIEMNPGFAQFTSIFGNGIIPEQFQVVQERENPYSCIYGSNYARGLEIMLDIWPEVKRQFPRATLDIYYGWQHWGLLSPEKEAKMRKQVSDLASVGVTEHGLVSHEELNRAYEKASFWTYPCIAPETFCITAIRAQLAGAVPVIIEGSALPETVPHGYKCSEQSEYLATLVKAMEQADKITLNDRKNLGKFVLEDFTWKALASKWKAYFDSSSNSQSVSTDRSGVKLTTCLPPFHGQGK